MFAPRKSDFDLTFTVFQINGQRHNRMPLCRNRGRKLQNFLFMQQELASAQRIAIEDIALFIRADVHPVDKGLSVLDVHIRFLDTAFAESDRFDLGSVQLNTALVFLFYEIIVVRLFIICDQLYICVCHVQTFSHLYAAPYPGSRPFRQAGNRLSA